jgi:dTDP-4-dehydrorhamnose reductase
VPDRVLITGAGGQVGRALLAAPWPAGLSPLGLTHAALNIADAAAIARALDDSGAVALVNAAAYTAVDKAESEPAAAWRANAEAVALLAAATAARGIPLLQLSTDFVFDGAKGAPYREDDAVNPLSVYGASKAAGEVAARANPQHLVLRTAWVFAAAGHNFVNTVLRLMAERPELTVVADQRGQPTAAGDIAATLVRLLALWRDGAAPWGTWHFAGAGETTWHGFAEAIVARAAGEMGKRPPVRPLATADWPAPARRPADSRLDCGKLERAFGLRPRPWPAMLADVLRERLG